MTPFLHMVIKTYSVSTIACTSHAGNANVMLCVTASCSIQSSINHINTRILGSLTWQKVQRVLRMPSSWFMTGRCCRPDIARLTEKGNDLGSFDDR